MAEFSLINLGELSKPATVLIEKISNAVGIVWEPRQIRRVAEAKADAAIILAKGDIEIDSLRRRAAQRFVEEETRKQLNMENVVANAIPEIDPNARTENVENDWITNFFEKCRSVSDDQMQVLWSRILSGEANSPGSFSRKTVNLVADLDKASAELFRTLCSFGWEYNDGLVPFILGTEQRIYNEHGLNLYSLGELASIGLIQINVSTGFALLEQPKRLTLTYNGRPVHLNLPKDEGNTLSVGQVIMTPSGGQLSRIVKPTPIDGFFEFIYDKWDKESLVPPRKG